MFQFFLFIFIPAFLITFGLGRWVDLRFSKEWPNAGIIFTISLASALLMAIMFCLAM